MCVAENRQELLLSSVWSGYAVGHLETRRDLINGNICTLVCNSERSVMRKPSALFYVGPSTQLVFRCRTFFSLWLFVEFVFLDDRCIQFTINTCFVHHTSVNKRMFINCVLTLVQLVHHLHQEVKNMQEKIH